ncbi:TonB-dependent receptor [Hymenobacter sp. BT186]|uniref:TonB-dependent receptor n=1 Tax=Hymenobacter telluris TaxID=2816474 RepID=A0A939F049_9BACT|nr:outer membrane beta-barrel family protein [Hymenobacter telluris]MBO0359720.1 TonB-dependent receptor [Hymenobacter telluris]MBW3375747.1 TonB-dependent receptor [Hymenobacter norwichensis]
MKSVLAISVLLGLYQPVAAQLPSPAAGAAATAPGRLTGSVVHATTKHPVEFATVSLLEPGTGKLVASGVCDMKGEFALLKVPAGDYKLSVSFVGFETKTLEHVLVSATTPSQVVTLVPAAQQLGEVKVTGQRELIENQADRLVYNAEKDQSNTGGTAADVLKKVPMLSLDPDGNPELRGSTSVRVLVNGKPSGMLANNLADALRRLPADQIKSVEVITSPSAKYDAEGSGGVINIILKKNAALGTTGSVSATAGNMNNSVNASVNRQSGKLMVASELGVAAYYNRYRSVIRRTDVLAPGELAELNQRTATRNYNQGLTGRLSFDYDLTKQDALTLGANTELFRYHSTRSISSSYLAPTLPDDVYRRQINWPFSNHFPSLDVNAGYTHTGRRPRQELSVLGLLSTSSGRQAYDLNQTRGEGLDYRETNVNVSGNRELTFQVDYAQPTDSTGLLEMGAKTILRRAGSDYTIAADSLNGRGLVLVPARSNEFNYQQNVYAGYLSYGFTLNKVYSFKAGTRVEHTRVFGDFANTTTTVRQQYTNVIPNVLVTRDFGADKAQKIKLGYTRRIQRPDIWLLNPYLNVNNGRQASSGNPTLRAELTDAYELGYSTSHNASTLNVSGYWRQTNNAIQQVWSRVPARSIFPDDTTNSNVLYNTFENVGRRATYGLSVTGSAKPTPAWTLNATVNAFYLNVASPALGLRNQGLMYNGNFSAGRTLDHGYSLQGSVYVNSRRILLQGNASGFYTHSLSVKKDLFDKKGSLTLNLENPFNRTMLFRADIAAPDSYNLRSDTYAYNRSVRVSFNYQFGSTTDTPARQRKSIRNDDQKKGENGG